jgi:arylsulfatase A-like enzyme
MVYEGGIRVPLIFWQKGKIKAGQWSDIPVDCNDIFPTFLQFAGQQIGPLPIDGMSLKPLLNDPKNTKKQYSRNTFYWHYPLNVKVTSVEDGLDLTPHSAIRKGDFKLIFDWYGRLKLYNIKDDIAEKNNLAFTKPALTNELFADLIHWLDTNVAAKYLPTENPAYKPEKESRNAPFVNLYKGFKEGKDVVKLAH